MATDNKIRIIIYQGEGGRGYRADCLELCLYSCGGTQVEAAESIARKIIVHTFMKKYKSVFPPGFEGSGIPITSYGRFRGGEPFSPNHSINKELSDLLENIEYRIATD